MRSPMVFISFGYFEPFGFEHFSFKWQKGNVACQAVEAALEALVHVLGSVEDGRGALGVGR